MAPHHPPAASPLTPMNDLGLVLSRPATSEAHPAAHHCPAMIPGLAIVRKSCWSSAAVVTSRCLMKGPLTRRCCFRATRMARVPWESVGSHLAPIAGPARFRVGAVRESPSPVGYRSLVSVGSSPVSFLPAWQQILRDGREGPICSYPPAWCVARVRGASVMPRLRATTPSAVETLACSLLEPDVATCSCCVLSRCSPPYPPFPNSVVPELPTRPRETRLHSSPSCCSLTRQCDSAVAPPLVSVLSVLMWAGIVLHSRYWLRSLCQPCLWASPLEPDEKATAEAATDPQPPFGGFGLTRLRGYYCHGIDLRSMTRLATD